jgi:hypothetical protein
LDPYEIVPAIRIQKHRPDSPYRAIDLTGQRFGRLVVLGRSAQNIRKRPAWVCQCDCGKKIVTEGRYLRKDVTKSCGCLTSDIQRERVKQWPKRIRSGCVDYKIEKDGETLTLKEWSEKLGLPLPTLINRWNRGVPDEYMLRPTVHQLKEKFKLPDPLENLMEELEGDTEPLP